MLVNQEKTYPDDSIRGLVGCFELITKQMIIRKLTIPKDRH